jgi:adenosylhomocysteine nucleosidase
VVATIEEKKRLRASGAVVEMEAAGVAARAAKHGLPFFCIRAVLDGAEEGFAVDYEALKNKDGRFSRPRILRAALARPWALLPELIRLERHGRVAARALGDFVADCRF